MWNYIVAIVLAVLTLIGCTGKKTEKPKSEGGKPGDFSDTLAKIKTKYFTKKQIEEKLEILATTKIPKDFGHGAMCYSISSNTWDIYYICPECGHKTVYMKETRTDIFEAKAIRNTVKEIEGVHVSFDEKELCRYCSPKVKKPSTYLYINISGEKDSIAIKNPEFRDVQLLDEFLAGSLLHVDMDPEPLINYIDRIKELFGLKPPEKKRYVE